MPVWRFLKQQYNFLIRAAATKLAVRAMYVFAVLESIIIPVPVDPLLVATVLARPARWWRLAIGCTIASVIGGVGGWAIGRFYPAGEGSQSWQCGLVPNRAYFVKGRGWRLALHQPQGLSGFGVYGAGVAAWARISLCHSRRRGGS